MPGTFGTRKIGSTASTDATAPELHATDVAAGAPTIHNPSPVGEAGKMPMSDGTKWVATSLAAVLPEHDHAGDIYTADGGTFPLTNLTSGDAQSGTSPVADGFGGIVWEDIAPIILAWKAYREADHTFSQINTWEDVVWDLKIDDECLPGVGFYDEGGVYENRAIIVVSGFEGLLRVMGSVEAKWGGEVTTTVTVATRVVVSNDEGVTWTEQRGLQSVVGGARRSNEVDSQPYLGTLLVQEGTWIKLQVRVNNLDMLLSGWTGFDHPVAASIAIDSIADFTVTIYDL